VNRNVARYAELMAIYRTIPAAARELQSAVELAGE